MAFSHSLLVFALVAAQGCLAATFLESTATTRAIAERRAQEWLRMHAGQDPDQEGLNELKATNPDAYGIVQALLTKKSMGLLNLKHPQPHSFNNQEVQQNDGPSALDVLRGSESQSRSAEAEASVDVPVEAVSVSSSHSHKDWLNWRPSDGDDAQVQNVLGAVSELKSNGGAATVEQPAEPQQAPTGADQQAHRLGALSLDWGNPYADSAQTHPVAAQQNSLSKYMDAGSEPSKPAPTASMSQQNSYLSSVGYLGKAPASQEEPQQSNALTNFNWFSASDGSDAPKANTGYLQQADEGKKDVQPLLGGALGKWLVK